jgi:hypothetical protein
MRGNSGPSAGNHSLKFKVDENLPAEQVAILREAGHDTDILADQKLSGVNYFSSLTGGCPLTAWKITSHYFPVRGR